MQGEACHSLLHLAEMNVADLPDKRAIIGLAMATMGCNTAIISTIENGHHHIFASHGDDHSGLNDLDSWVGEVLQSAQMVVRGDDHSDAPLYIGLPICSGNETAAGVLSIIGEATQRLSDADHRALDHLTTIVNTLIATQGAHRLATESRTELHITLENMDQGVTVFDADARLVLWNQRYLEIFEKDAEDVYKGVSLEQLIAKQNVQNGFEGLGDDFPQMMRELRAGLARGEIVPGGVRLNSGRIISSIHAAMPNGGWVATHSDITERVRAQEKIEHASLHDPMTGLVNRAKFAAEFDDRNEGDGYLVVMLVDIDHFKAVNDTYGHGAGDAVIMSVASRLKSCVHKDDVVARLGGDEFALLLHVGNDADPETAHTVAANVVERMGEELSFQGTVINFSVSVGYHAFAPGQCDLEKALTCADFALYKAKERGRARCQFFNPRLARELYRSKHMQSLVRQDTYAEKFDVHYQPIVSLCSGQDYGFEALIRWVGGQSEYMEPIDIIQAAEQNGAIGSLGNWVLNRALQDHTRWGKASRITVNVSPRQLGQGEFVEQVESALNRWDVAPEHLELEVTETALLQDMASIEELHALKQLGVQIALDDFGTGYSSLTLLQRFPFDKLKVDRSFVDRVDSDAMSQAIVRSVVQLGRDLRISTVAEGIETERHRAVMDTMGCTLGQGFLLGRPMEADAVIKRTRHARQVA